MGKDADFSKMFKIEVSEPSERQDPFLRERSMQRALGKLLFPERLRASRGPYEFNIMVSVRWGA